MPLAFRSPKVLCCLAADEILPVFHVFVLLLLLFDFSVLAQLMQAVVPFSKKVGSFRWSGEP